MDGDVAILSISVDLPFAQKRFCAAEHLDNVHVYSDHRDLDFGMKYGFVIRELRLLGRGVVVIDKKGMIRHIESPTSDRNPTTKRRSGPSATSAKPLATARKTEFAPTQIP